MVVSDLSRLRIIRGDIPLLERYTMPYVYAPSSSFEAATAAADGLPSPAEAAPAGRLGRLAQFFVSHLNDPRMMARLARSGNARARSFAVRNLCGLHDLPDHALVAIAQACDYRTLISLARCRDADPRLFSLPPYVQPKSKGHESLLKAMVLLLEGMDEVNSSDACAKHFTSVLLVKMALLAQRGSRALRHDYTDLGGDSSATCEGTDNQEAMISDVLLKWFMRVLYLQTSEPALRHAFVRLGGLQLVQRLLCSHQRVDELRAAAAGVLANLALDEGLHEAIVQSGSLALLADWLRSDDSLLSSKVATALSNLDREAAATDADGDGCEGARYLPGVVLLYPTFADQQATAPLLQPLPPLSPLPQLPLRPAVDPVAVDVVLVHGLRGGPVKTWRQSDAATEAAAERCDCWPKKWLPVDCPNVRVLAVEYDTMLTEWVAAAYCPHDKHLRTIERRAEDMLDKLALAGVGRRPVVWLGHSLGGLLVERMLVHANEAAATADADGRGGCNGGAAVDAVTAARRQSVLASTRAVVLCSVPHRGATLAGIGQHARYLLYPATEVQELRPGSGELEALRAAFAELARATDFSVVNFHETLKTKLGGKVSMLLVPGEIEGHDDNGMRAQHISLNEDHLGTCKPASKASPLYSTIVNLVKAASAR